MQTKVTVTINRSALSGRTQKALKGLAVELGKALDNAISDPIWEYSFPPSPRDIVDKGDLLRSRRTRIDGNSIVSSWDVPHAIHAHEGATLRNGTRLPARRWTVKALQSIDLPEVFKKNF